MLKDVELMLLEQLEYLNREVTETAGVFPGSWEGRSVGEILAVFDEDALRRLAEKKDEEVGTLISGREWSVLIPAIRKNERLSKLVCVGRTEPDTQKDGARHAAKSRKNAGFRAGKCPGNRRLARHKAGKRPGNRRLARHKSGKCPGNRRLARHQAGKCLGFRRFARKPTGR